MTPPAPTPVRRSPWPYGIAAGLAVVIGVNLWLVRLAAGDPPVAEIEKPYEVGLAYENELAALRASASLGYQATVEARDGRVRVRLQDPAGAAVAKLAGELKLTRPDRADKDQVLVPQEIAPGQYEAVADLLPAGNWRLRSRLTGAAGTWLDDRRLWIQP